MARRFMEFREIREVSEFNPPKSQNHQDKDIDIDLDEVLDYENCRKQINLDKISEELDREDFSDCGKKIDLDEVVKKDVLGIEHLDKIDHAVGSMSFSNNQDFDNDAPVFSEEEIGLVK